MALSIVASIFKKSYHLVMLLSRNLKLIADDLAADCLGQFIAEYNDSGILIRRGMELNIVLDFLL